ncbi:MAG: MutS-related protein [Propionibacteriaceae bacterium]
MSCDTVIAVATEPIEGVSLLGPFSRSDRGACVDAQTMRDLALDPVIARLELGRNGYHLREEYVRLLGSETEVGFRQDVFRDLDGTPVRAVLHTFCQRMVDLRRTLPGKRMRYQIERERWFLEAAAAYGEAVRQLAAGLDDAPLCSAGLRGVRDFLHHYVTSSQFRGLAGDAEHLLQALDGVRYRLRIDAGLVEVSRVRDDEPDYVQDVTATFERFRQDPVTSYRHTLPSAGGMDHVHAAIARFVARLYPDVFQDLHSYAVRYADLIHPQVTQFEREAQFYLAYLDLMDDLRSCGVDFCYPTMDPTGRLHIDEGMDLALALSLYPTGRVPVANTCELSGEERVVVVTGPNQGGKTTFARTIGQIQMLAALGLPVPAAAVRTPLIDGVWTLFEKGENVYDLRGHLYDDLVRAREMTDNAGKRSLVILNELFSSTALEDAVFLGTKVIEEVLRRGPRCVYVTFLDELSRLPGTVSYVAAVDPQDPTKRTFHVVPQPADGLAFAQALADRYGLSKDALEGRLAR